MLRVQAQDSAASPLPDWLADAPPWLQVTALILVVLGPFLPLLVPAIAHRIRGRTTETAAGSSPTASSPGSATTSSSAPVPAPVERYDAKMALIERMLGNVEAEQERDRAEMADMRARIRDLEQQLRDKDEAIRARDAMIADLRRTIDQLTRPAYPPQWPQAPGPGHSRGS